MGRCKVAVSLHGLHVFVPFAHFSIYITLSAQDCLDSHFWGYTARDLAVELGKAVWQAGEGPSLDSGHIREKSSNLQCEDSFTHLRLGCHL